MPETPEQKARHEIDTDLVAAGWLVQDRDELDLTAGRGIAVREFHMKAGFGDADYLLYLDRRAVGAVEAKAEALSRDLAARGLSGMSVSMLERMRRLYIVYPQLAALIPSPVVTELKSLPVAANSVTTGDGIRPDDNGAVRPLPAETVVQFSWTHLQEFLWLDDPLKRAFYENECLKGNWSKRQLQRQIESLLYERTGLSTDKQAVIARARWQASEAPAESIGELIRDSYVVEFTGLAERPAYSEDDLETALLDHLQRFLLELGAGFCFEARQFRVTMGNRHHRVDLVFYHRRLRCHVLLDLKVRAFRPTDAGQMNLYVNWFKANMMAEGDGPPVGIILCSSRKETEVEFATGGMDNKLFVSRYLTVLPSAEQLKAPVDADRAYFEQQHPRLRHKKKG